MPLISYANTSVYRNETPGHPRHKLGVSGDYIWSGPIEDKTVSALEKVLVHVWRGIFHPARLNRNGTVRSPVGEKHCWGPLELVSLP
jgi:hypothetical protein